MPEPASRPPLPASHAGAVARLAIAVAAIAVLGITILRHELWRDELQAWQIARASHGFHNLAHNTRYEGHPIVWFALLYPFAHAHAGPGAMQLLQFFIASTTISVAVWRAPFTLLQKVLMVFGYFVLYEYGVLARSYGLGAMLLVVACALAGRPGRRRWPAIGAILALVALTSAFGALVAVAVLAGLGVDEILRRRNRPGPEGGTEARAGAVVVGVTLTLAALVVAYVQAGRPPANTGNYSHWRTDIDVGLGASSVSAVWRALVPVPALEHAYWNTNILSARAAVMGLLGLALFVGIAWLFRDRPGALVVWVGGVGLIVALLYARIGTATASRHVGHIFLVLLAAMWLAPTMQQSPPSRARSDRHGASPRFPNLPLTRSATRSRARSDRHGASPRFPNLPLTRSGAWTALLAVQVIAGIFAVSLDLVYPFSNGRDVAEYIRRERLQHLEIVGTPDTAASTVAGYLDRPIYYLAGARDGTFITWDTTRNRSQPLESVVGPPSGDSTGTRVLVLLNHPTEDPNLRLRLLAHFDNGIVGDEHFWLYLGTARTNP